MGWNKRLKRFKKANPPGVWKRYTTFTPWRKSMARLFCECERKTAPTESACHLLRRSGEVRSFKSGRSSICMELSSTGTRFKAHFDVGRVRGSSDAQRLR